MATVAIRCASNHWGYAHNATGEYDTLCKGKYCRDSAGNAVKHVFNLATGDFETKLTTDQGETPQELQHGSGISAV